jgi:hypothetical protein
MGVIVARQNSSAGAMQRPGKTAHPAKLAWATKADARRQA